MPEQKKKGGFRQAALALLVLYAVITLLPAAVYGASQLPGEEKNVSASSEAVSPTDASEAGSSQPEEPQQPQTGSGAPAVSVPLESGSSAPESAPSAAPAASAPPDFLDGLSLPGKAAAVPASDSFTLHDTATGEDLTVPVEDFLPAALACEMDLSAPKEALKAQAVAIHTLFTYKQARGEELVCDSANWQNYVTETAMRERWGEDYDGNWALLKEAAAEAGAQLLTQNGAPICAAYFAISSGSTEDAANVWEQGFGYLQAVASPGDRLTDGYLSTAQFTAGEFQEAAAAAFGGNGIDLSGSEDTWLTGLTYSPSGYVTSAVLGGKEVSGTELRAAFSLRSACFEPVYQDGTFTFTVRGWGHGVGMSQAGAGFLAKQGADYREILAHYYPGTTLTSLK